MKIKGKNVNLYIYRSGTPTLAVCSTNVSAKRSAERINVTTIDSGRDNEYIGGALDGEITFDGVRIIGESDWEADEFEDNIGNLLQILLVYEDDNGNSVAYDGNVLVTDVSDSNNATDFSTFSVTMLKSGEWVKLTNVIVDGVNYLVDSNGDMILDGSGNPIIVP